MESGDLKMKKVINPHDRLFREIWGKKSVAADFLQNYLPGNVLGLANLTTIEICKDSFIEKELEDYFSDLLYKVKLKDKPGYVYLLFEHKSYPEKHIHLQILEYKVKIWRLHLKQNPDELPVIVPIVLYHGRTKHGAEKRSSGMMNISEPGLSVYIPDFEYVLCDLTAYSDDEIRGAVLSRVVMLPFKHIRDPDIMEKLPGILSLIRYILDSEACAVWKPILRYVFSILEGITAKELKDIAENSNKYKVPSELKGDIFTRDVIDIWILLTLFHCGSRVMPFLSIHAFKNVSLSLPYAFPASAAL